MSLLAHQDNPRPQILTFHITPRRTGQTSNDAQLSSLAGLADQATWPCTSMPRAKKLPPPLPSNEAGRVASYRLRKRPPDHRTRKKKEQKPKNRKKIGNTASRERR